jgi:Ca2+-binding EF-hand superfamily protein
VIPCALGALLLGAASARAQQPAYDPHKAFMEADKNKDNAIEMSEFYERSVDVFFLGDKNKDGKLSKEEYDAVVVIQEDYKQVDTDGDGMISESEFITARVPLFKQADANHDGKLSEQEVTSAYEAKKK